MKKTDVIRLLIVVIYLGYVWWTMSGARTPPRMVLNYYGMKITQRFTNFFRRREIKFMENYFSETDNG